MKRFVLGLILLLGLVPLTACNQQNRNKAPGAHEQHERGLGERRERGMGGERHGGGRGRLRQACADDIAKYCSGMDRPRLKRQCLRTHLDQLSTDCKAAIEKGGEGRRRRDL